ncbi:MAG: helix-turn-helix transcriptional regulator [Bacteroidales bacterium]|nr:helix-turn-helix transcriptional regulator [Bacteroidales bacterium]
MKERLIQLLDLEQLSPSKFADLIGVQRSSISHVLSGRNKPSFDFLQKTLKAFPGLNASWLMTGEGSMYEQMGRKVSGNLFDIPVETEEPDPGRIPEQHNLETETRGASEAVKGPEKPEAAASAAKSSAEGGDPAGVPTGAIAEALGSGKRKILQVLVIYEDDTFRSFTPAN